MNLVSLSSPKGGVGKTTLTANLAHALKRLGHRVVVIDFDVQNALRLHFGLGFGEGRGFVAQAVEIHDWRRLLVPSASGIELLPYGEVSDAQRLAFESWLSAHPEAVAQRLGPLLNEPRCVVLADLPPGPSPSLAAMGAADAIQVAVLLADSASLSVLPRIEGGDFMGPGVRPYYIINQVDRRRRLSSDVADFLQDRLGSPLLGNVHRDEAIPEALACEQSIFDYAPASAAAHDIDTLARSVSRLLPSLQSHGVVAPTL